MALREVLLEFGIEIDEGAEQRAENAVDGLTSGLDRLKRFAIGAGAVLLTGRLARGFASMIVQAGDAAEVANKFGAVYEGAAERAAAAVDDMAKRTGQSRIALQEMTADAGALVKPLLGDAEAAADMGLAMAELSLDISSFEEVNPEQALGALRSAIIGSSEPMLRFGVDTRAAALAQFALDQGITKSTKSMSQAELVALRMQLITERLGTKGAIGDATKTAGSFINRLRALRGALADAAADIGTEFLPMATEMLRLLIELVRDALPTLVRMARFVAPILGAIGRVLEGVVRGLTGADKWLLLTSAAAGALAIALQAAGAAGLISGLKIAAGWALAILPVLLFIALIALIIEDLVRMGQGHDSVIGTMIDGITDLIDEWGGVAPAIWEMLKTALLFWANYFGLNKDQLDQWIEDLESVMFDFWPNVIDAWKDAFGGFLAWVDKGLRSISAGVLDLVGNTEAANKVRTGTTRQAVAAGAGALAGAVGVLAPGAGVGAATAAALAAPAAGGGAPVNVQSNSNVSVSVDASSTQDPQLVADLTATKIREELERRDRQTAQSYRVGAQR